MEFYQPYSILFSHSDDPNDELRIHTRVYVPGYQKLQVKITPSSPTPGVATTDIAIKAILSSTDREDRIEEIIALLDWDGNAHTVNTEVKDLANGSGGKNALHTDGAIQY